MDTIEVKLPASIVVQLPAAAGGESVVVPTSDLPGHILATLVSFGIKQKLDHKVAGNIKAGVSTSDSRKECDAVIDQLTGGTWAKRGGGPRATTFEAWAAKQADKVAADLVKAGKRYAGKDAAAVAAALLKHEAWMLGRRKVWDEMQERKGSSDLDLDLG